MDRELAQAVFQRWNDGLPVAETSLVKAASVLGVDPDDALLEARFFTMLDRDLTTGDPLSKVAMEVYSAAAGLDGSQLTKVASAYHLDARELVFQKLAERNWVPDLSSLRTKLAQLGMVGMGSMAGADMLPMGNLGEQDPGAPLGDAAQPPTGADPTEGQPSAPGAVQQIPEARYKPSPMAPMQSPPSAEGNLM